MSNPATIASKPLAEIPKKEPSANIEEARTIIFSKLSENGNNIFEYVKPLTDTGAAERFAILQQHEVKYCAPWKKWLIWDGRRWSNDNTYAVTRKTKAVTRQLYTGAAKIQDDRERRETLKFLIKSESTAKVKAMHELLKSEVPILPEQLDQNKWLLNLENGTYDLKTAEFKQHNSKDYITKLAPVEYDENATCPLWIEFVNEIMAGDLHMISFLQQVIGYALTGDTSEQAMFILYGLGANGKSTFLETIGALVGDYGTATPIETLLIKREGISNDIARLKGARFVYAMEAAQNKRLAESLIKQLTGGDRITARFLHAEFFEFHPEFKLFLATNHRPVIRGTDWAIWRRIHLIPFTVEIPKEKQDKNLKEKLIVELPGIMNWALAGCDDWLRNGLFYPEPVIEATGKYKSEMDILGDFITDCIDKERGSEVTTKVSRRSRSSCILAAPV